MIDILERQMNKAYAERVHLLKKTGYYSIKRLFIRLTANTILPLYLILTSKSSKNKLSDTEIEERKKLIVTLTSFPARIGRVWLTIESILRQEVKPDKLYLWLSREQFASLEVLPSLLLKQQARGLKIILCDDDLKPHKKYFYAMQKHPNDDIITVDDDTMYGSQTVKILVETSKKYPNSICGNRCEKIAVTDGTIENYNSWERLQTAQEPSFFLFATGMGGVLYPPKVLNEILFDVDAIKKTCLIADDVWLNAMAQVNGTKTTRTHTPIDKYLHIMFRKNSSLTRVNVKQNLNDIQIENVRSYCINVYKFDPYKEITSN